MFLVSYPLALLYNLFLLKSSLIQNPDIVNLLLTTAVGIAVDKSYLVGYFRLPLYPVSGLSSLRAYLASRDNPPQTLTCLHRSSLHWDERVYLPLPGLKQTLLIAATQDVQATLQEITFIVAERPQQIRAARHVALVIAIDDLEQRKSLSEIAQASQRLAEILPPESKLIDPQWATPLRRLNDASLDSARYGSPVSRQAKREALEDMLKNLGRVYPNVAFRDVGLNKRLGQVVDMWMNIARHELGELEKIRIEIGSIDNPFMPAKVLVASDEPFFGRRDLVQQLEEALSRGRSRPTFLLNGERRMGKSSTLRQLPRLLGARYVPVFYDLQRPRIMATTAAFLANVAREVEATLLSRGIQFKKLKYEVLQQSAEVNEAAVYGAFDEWLENIEKLLEREDRTLLLTFDEFEKLEEARRDGYLNLRLLLDWFRNVIQYRPRLALLFSGVRTLGEMGPNWAGYFVNVQTLKVSFLKPGEARQLITKPVENFPGEEVYGEGVVDAIMTQTGCHPFLVQAVCSALIDNLNTEKREQANVQDVTVAVNEVLEKWWDTYFRDLWERTDQEQQVCLFALRGLGEGDMQAIAGKSSLDEKTVRNTLQILLKRDLVLKGEDGGYRIAAPIFEEWVERNA